MQLLILCCNAPLWHFFALVPVKFNKREICRKIQNDKGRWLFYWLHWCSWSKICFRKKKYISSEFVEKNKLSESQLLGPLCKAHSQENKQRKSGIRFMLKVKMKKCLFSKSFSKNQIRIKSLTNFYAWNDNKCIFIFFNIDAAVDYASAPPRGTFLKLSINFPRTSNSWIKY